MIELITTRQQREIVPIALDLAKKVAQDVAMGSRRLNISGQNALELVGALAYLRGEFAIILPAQHGIEVVRVHSSGAKMLRTALGLWAAKVLDRDKGDQQLALVTNVRDVHKQAQDLLDQVSEQLHLPLVDITELDAKPRDESDKEFAEGTERAPHLGVDHTTARTKRGATNAPVKSKTAPSTK